MLRLAGLLATRNSLFSYCHFIEPDGKLTAGRSGVLSLITISRVESGIALGCAPCFIACWWACAAAFVLEEESCAPSLGVSGWDIVVILSIRNLDCFCSVELLLTVDLFAVVDRLRKRESASSAFRRQFHENFNTECTC